MRKRRPMARALSLLLSLVLALSLLPGAALAEGTESTVYTPAEVDSVLNQVVKGNPDEDLTYDLDGDKTLTTWDAKKMLDTLPDKLAGTIRFKAMRIKDGKTDWVDVTIQDGKVSETTVLNEFTGTLNELRDKRYPNYKFYPEAGALCGGKLMLQVTYFNNGTTITSDLVPVDPDSFAAPAVNVAGEAFDLHDVTAYSDGLLLGVSSGSKTVLSLWQDGKWMAEGNLEKSALYGSVLVGIASAGTNNNGDEVLYGLAKDGKLYRFSLTVSVDGSLAPTTPVQIGENNVIPDWYKDPEDSDQWQIDSASLLATGGYLLASVTYVHTREYSDGTSKTEYQSVVFVIDPVKGSCVPVALPEGTVLNSLYQYEQGKSAGTQLYVETDTITLKAGDTADLPAAEAYTFSTDKNGLVTNEPVTPVTWKSSNEDVVSIGTKTGKITAANVEEKATATLTATAAGVTKTVTVTVNPATGMKVGAMIETDNSTVGTVWAEIKLDEFNDDGSFKDISVKGTLGDSYTGVGYAQGKPWGVNGNDHNLYSFDAEGNATKEYTVLSSQDSVVDLTGAPETIIKYNDGTQTVTESAPLVYVTYSGQIGLLNGTIIIGNSSGPFVSDEDDKTIYELSAITYVGDLTAAQVRTGANDSSLGNCTGDTLCHVYYALTRDDAINGATLRQLILVPQVDVKDNTPTLSYVLCGKTIGMVKKFNSSNNSPTALGESMDFLRNSDGSYRLLVARSDPFGTRSIWYIDLWGEEGLTAKQMGTLSKVTVDGKSLSVNGISGLYRTNGAAMTADEIRAAAGWITPQSLAEVTLEASLKAVSAEGSEDAATITVSVKADKDATNGLWTLTYDSTKLNPPAVGANANIHYFAYDITTDDTTNVSTLTVGFASREAVSKDQSIFTVTFTAEEGQSASDVKLTQVELNNPKDNTGGNTGGNSGTVTPSKPETLPFTDVEEGSYCYDAVRWAVEKGVTEGVSESSFAPNQPCTRGQAVTFLWRAAGSPAPESQEMPFTDVAESSPYAKAILWAAENGVTKGVTETLFAPNAPCTRGQIVTFLYRSQGAPAQAGSNPFTDVAEESPYLAAILWAAENGVTKGVTETTFAPNNTCVRGQIVTFLYRLWS